MNGKANLKLIYALAVLIIVLTVIAVSAIFIGIKNDNDPPLSSVPTSAVQSINTKTPEPSGTGDSHTEPFTETDSIQSKPITDTDGTQTDPAVDTEAPIVTDPPVVTTTTTTTTTTKLITKEPEIYDPPILDDLPVFDEPLLDEINVAHTAHSVMIYDLTSDRLIYTTDMHRKVYPASTTKVVTTLYALTLLAVDEVFTVGSEIYLLEDNASLAYLKRGQIITMEQLLYAIYLPSGADAAYVVAANAGRRLAGDKSLAARKAVDLFLSGLDEFIKDLGMTDSHFASPDGYPNKDTYTSLHDMMIAAKIASQNETIRRISSTKSIKIKLLSGEEFSWTNVNRLLGKFYDKESDKNILCEGVFGLKTGYTSQAGGCLISLTERNGQAVAVLVYGASTGDKRFLENVAFIEYAFEFLKNEEKLDSA